MDKDLISSLKSQNSNAEIWKGLGGSGSIKVVYTIREAVNLVRENYKGAEVLVTGIHHLAGGMLSILQSEEAGEDAKERREVGIQE